MSTLEKIRTKLIDRILTINNEKLLKAVDSILDSTQSDQIISLTSEQIEMLLMSDQDIENENLISESELDKSDIEWLD